MLEEKFADGETFVHQLDPRLKAVIAVIFSVLIAVSGRFPVLFLSMAVALVLVWAAKLSARLLASRILAVNAFLLFLWITLPFTYPGAIVLNLGPLGVSKEGLTAALLITIKSNAIILACIALLSTTHLVEMGRALERLRVPPKIVDVLLLMMRYLEAVSREYQWLKASMKMRCFRPKTNLHTYRSYANMIGMLLISSYERAEAVYAAMLCRGFKGRFYALDDFSINAADIFFGLAMGAILILIGLLEWTRLLV